MTEQIDGADDFKRIIGECRRVVADPYGYAASLKENGATIVGTFCSYAPEELIVAAGAVPFRIFGSGARTRLAEAHLQSYCCSLVRGSLEDALAGRLAFLDGVVFPHTCDSLQRLSDIWRLNIPSCFHWDVVLPVKLTTEASLAYFTEVLRRLRGELQEKLGRDLTDEGLKAAVGLYNDLRDDMTRIYGLAALHPGLVAAADLHTLGRAAMIMERGAAASLLKGAAAALMEKAKARPEGRGSPAAKAVVLAGGLCDSADLYRVVEEAGGVVVGDDLCTGSRYFAGGIDLEGDLLKAIAARYAGRICCPAKHQGLSARAGRLLELVGKTGAKGVILYHLKFCDPHAFDYPYLKEALAKEGVPCLLIEAQDSPASPGQIRTRCEAFLEMIGD